MGMRGLHVDLELGLVAVLARTHAQVACSEHAVARSLELLFGVELLLYLTILFVELVQALRHVGIVGISRRHGQDAYPARDRAGYASCPPRWARPWGDCPDRDRGPSDRCPATLRPGAALQPGPCGRAARPRHFGSAHRAAPL